MHLFVDISSHGFGHLAMTAPVLNEYARQRPDLRLTLRSGLSRNILQKRIQPAFEHIQQTSDFGFAMVDAMTIDHAASAARYREFHANWPEKVAQEAEFLRQLAPDGVFSNVAYLPLAGAAQAGIPAVAMCSLNWADLFQYYYGKESWAPDIHTQILAAYRSAQLFLRPTPSMPMPDLDNTRAIGPIATLGKKHNLKALLPHPLNTRTRYAILVLMGGVRHRLPIETWPHDPDICWLVQADWQINHPQAVAFESLNLAFPDLMASANAVISKPGYGTFTEAACNGTPVLYLRRDDWPEQEALTPWLEEYGQETAAETFGSPQFVAELRSTLSRQRRRAPGTDGIRHAISWLSSMHSLCLNFRDASGYNAQNYEI